MRGEKNIDRITAMTPGTPGAYQRMHSNDSDYSVCGSNAGSNSGTGGNNGGTTNGGGQGGTQNTITPSNTGRSSVD